MKVPCTNLLKKIAVYNSLVILPALLMVACGGSSNGGRPSNNPITKQQSVVAFASSSALPLIGGNTGPFTTYIINNSDHVINGVSCSGIANYPKDNLATQVVEVSCPATLAPKQPIPVSFKVPSMPTQANQVAVMLNLSYNDSKGNKSSAQGIINGVNVPNSGGSVAAFGVTVPLNGVTTNSSYFVQYVYAPLTSSGDVANYTINSVTSDKSGVEVLQAPVGNSSLSSGAVVPVLLRTGHSNVAYTANLVIDSTLTNVVANSEVMVKKNNSIQMSLDSTSGTPVLAPITVTAIGQGAILLTSVMPVINSAANSPGGTLFIQNAGNESATLSGINGTNGILANLGNCPTILAPNAGCSANITVPQAGGSGVATVSYSGNVASGATSTSQSVTWYNGIGTPLVQFFATPNSLSFTAGSSANTVVSVTNVGGYSLTLANAATALSFPQQGSATVTINSSSCNGTNYTLAIGSTCTYNVTVADSAQQIFKSLVGNFQAAYLANESYTQSALLTYSATPNAPALWFSPVNSMTVMGDNIESVSQAVTLNNTGSAVSANLGSGAFYQVSGASLPAYLTNSASTCGATLAAGTSCNLTFKLGPIANPNPANITGSVYYAFSGELGFPTNNFTWTVTPDSQGLVITNVTASGNYGASSTGESIASQYTFLGSVTPSTQYITLTYTNKGTQPVTVTGIDESSSASVYWLYDNTNPTTPCYITNGTNISGATVAVNGTCSVRFKNQLYLESGMTITATQLSQSLTVPSYIIFNDVNTSQFIQSTDLSTVSGRNFSNTTQVAAQSVQGLLTNTLVVSNASTTNPKVTVTNTWNDGGLSTVYSSPYSGSPAVAKSVVAGIASVNTVTTSGCSTATSNGNITQTCNIAVANANDTQNVVYTVSAGQTGNFVESVIAQYSSSLANSQYIAMSSVSSASSFGPLVKAFYQLGTTLSSLASGIAVNESASTAYVSLNNGGILSAAINPWAASTTSWTTLSPASGAAAASSLTILKNSTTTLLYQGANTGVVYGQTTPTSWSTLVSGTSPFTGTLPVNALAVYNTSTPMLFAANASTPYLYWTQPLGGAVAWYQFGGAALPILPSAMVIDPSGNIYIGGNDTVSGAAVVYVAAATTGNSWTKIGSGGSGIPTSAFTTVTGLAIVQNTSGSYTVYATGSGGSGNGTNICSVAANPATSTWACAVGIASSSYTGAAIQPGITSDTYGNVYLTDANKNVWVYR